MSVSEAQRNHLFQWFENHMGKELADAMMSLLPPVGWADVATKRDLDALGDRLDRKIDAGLAALDAKLDLSVAALDAKIDAGVAALDRKIDAGLSSLDAKLDLSVAALDAKIDSLDAKLDLSVAALDAKIDSLGVRVDVLAADVGQLRRDMDTMKGQLVGWMIALQATVVMAMAGLFAAFR